MNFIKALSSNQHYGIVVLIFSIIYTILGLTMEEGFFSDPVGSNVWVQGVGAILVLLSILLVLFPPNFIGKFPVLKEWLSRLPFIIIIISYSYILPLLGFALSTPILMTLVGILFGAPRVLAVVAAVSMTIGCYLIFDFALGISLPSGLWFR